MVPLLFFPFVQSLVEDLRENLRGVKPGAQPVLFNMKGPGPPGLLAQDSPKVLVCQTRPSSLVVKKASKSFVVHIEMAGRKDTSVDAKSCRLDPLETSSGQHEMPTLPSCATKLFEVSSNMCENLFRDDADCVWGKNKFEIVLVKVRSFKSKT